MINKIIPVSKMTAAMLLQKRSLAVFIGCVMFAASVIVFAGEVAEDSFEKKVLGCWYDAYNEDGFQGFQILRFFPDKTCLSRTVFKVRGLKIPSETEEKFRFEGDRIIYTVTRSSQGSLYAVGSSRSETIGRMTKTEFVYSEPTGETRTRKKISEFYAGFLWITRTVFK